MPNEEVVRVRATCPKCGKVDDFTLPKLGLKHRSRGVSLRKAFPDLPEWRIMQLAKHLCKDCQEKEAKVT